MLMGEDKKERKRVTDEGGRGSPDRIWRLRETVYKLGTLRWTEQAADPHQDSSQCHHEATNSHHYSSTELNVCNMIPIDLFSGVGRCTR